MSNETTPAYVRAVQAAAGSYSTPDGVADAVLDSALSVEEMAFALGQHRIECTGLEGVTCRGCRELGWMSRYAFERHQAKAVRTALLGTTS